jgi:hypothetical protein
VCNVGFEARNQTTYLGASSGVGGKEPNVARMVVSLKRSGTKCQDEDAMLLLKCDFDHRTMITGDSERRLFEQWQELYNNL